MVFGLGVSDADVDLSLQFNGDTGLNYRRYRMVGSGASASASAGDSEDSIVLNEMRRSAYPTLAIIKITGDSSDERYVDALSSGTTNSNTRIGKYSFYWKDTLDNLDEITVRGEFSGLSDATIALFATPKGINTENWELVEEANITGNISNSGTPYQFSGLDLYAAGQYKLVIEDMNTPGGVLFLRANNVTSASAYTNQRLVNNAGTIQASNATETRIYPYAANGNKNIELVFSGETGSKRLVQISGSRITNTNVRQQTECATWINDTVSNITSIEVESSSPTAVDGTARLYKKKNPDTVADRFNLPFKMIKEVDVSGDFSAGHTFSGLEGDKVLMYKIEGYLDGSPEVRMQFAGDAASNYDWQRLRGNNSTASSALLNSTSFRIADPSSGQPPSYFEYYIYPQAGENRPALGTWWGGAQNIVNFNALWWDDSVTELDSIKIFGSNSNAMAGTLRLSYIPLSTDIQGVDVTDFDGSNDYISVSDSASLTSSSFAAEIWIKPDSTSDQSIIEKSNPNTNQRAWEVGVVSGNIKFAVYNGPGGGATQDSVSSSSISAGTWYHILAIHDDTGNELKLFVNNVETSKAYSAGVAGGTADLHISSRINGAGARVEYFNGDMGFARVYDDNITDLEAGFLYNTGEAITYGQLTSDLKSKCVMNIEMSDRNDSLEDNSGNNNDGTANGGVTIGGGETIATKIS